MLNHLYSFLAENFDYICISIAVLLAAFSVKQYKIISIIVALEFILHNLAYNYAFLEFRDIPGNGWFIYLMYASIQLSIMAFLFGLKSHFIIIGLVFINMVYNLLTIKGFFDVEFISFYYIYPYFVGTIMIFELLYLGLLNRYVSNYYRKRGRIDFDHIDGVFYVWPKCFNRFFPGAAA